MKKVLLFLFFVAIFPLKAEKLSPTAKRIAFDLKNQTSYEKITNEHSLKTINNNDYVGALIKIDDKFDIKQAEALGAKIGSKIGDILTVQIPLSRFLDFVDLNGFSYLETGDVAYPLMDSALSNANIAKVNAGLGGLPQAYNGKGVIIGVVDEGFDYTHPMFYDTLNKKIIISRVWEQKGTGTGTAPADFSYGRELIGDSAILASAFDDVGMSHGSHVAGIVAGQGWASGGLYRGVAPESELVIVGLNRPTTVKKVLASASDFIDGVNYIFRYAETQGKPAVVNLSWGGPTGAHDGKTLFCQAIDSLVGPGKIFVTSAGNNGYDSLHFIHIFSASDTSFKTYCLFSSSLPSSATVKGVNIDAWGELNKNFALNISISNTANTQTYFSTDFINTAIDSIYQFKVPIGSDTCRISITASHPAYNNKPNINIAITCAKKYCVGISGKALDGTVNMWNNYSYNNVGYTTNFTRVNDSKAERGDNKQTISSFACGYQSISVGALVSKKSYTAEEAKVPTTMNYGKVGQIAGFSSFGPSIDGRVKPDITAPGSVIISSINSYDTNYLAKSSSVVIRVAYNNKKYPYAAFSGTSMSSPVTAGAIALMLQANPKLTPQEVKTLLSETALTDTNTSSVIPNNIWGAGKLNLLKAIQIQLGLSAVEESIAIEENGLIYPNPASEYAKINIDKNGYAQAQILNSLGENVLTQNVLLPNPTITSLNLINDGVYTLLITQNSRVIFTGKLCVRK